MLQRHAFLVNFCTFSMPFYRCLCISSQNVSGKFLYIFWAILSSSSENAESGTQWLFRGTRTRSTLVNASPALRTTTLAELATSAWTSVLLYPVRALNSQLGPHERKLIKIHCVFLCLCTLCQLSMSCMTVREAPKHMFHVAKHHYPALRRVIAPGRPADLRRVSLYHSFRWSRSVSAAGSFACRCPYNLWISFTLHDIVLRTIFGSKLGNG